MSNGTIGLINLIQALNQGHQDQVGAGSTTSTINSGLPQIYVANQFQGGYIWFLPGTANPGTFAEIASNTTTAFSLSAPLANVPAEGDEFLIFMGPTVNVAVSAPENVAQWAGTGTAAPADDGADAVAAVSGGLPKFLARLTAWTGSAWSRLKLAASGSLQTRDDASYPNGTANADITNVLLVGASTDSGGGPVVPLQSGSNGGLEIANGLANGTAYSGTSNGLLAVGGSDGTYGRVLHTDGGGNLILNTQGNTGSAVPASAILVGGTDGTDLRALATDSGGNIKLFGLTSGGAGGYGLGSTFFGIGGSDGANARLLLMDTTGRPIITSTGTLTDGSGTVTAGGTAQTVFAANAARRYLLIQNNSTSALWVNFTATAVAGQPSLQLAAGQAFVMENGTVSTEAISIIGATTGQAFTAKEM
jgi:hypothetical protein